MPSIKDFEKKAQTSKASSTAEQAEHLHEAHSAQAKAKRRPGREHVAVVDVDSSEPIQEAEAPQQEPHVAAEEPVAEKTEIHFYGSEILRAKFPKVFEVAESVASDWMHDGNFESLPLGHPLAQYFAAKGLKKAKEVEKKVLESPVTEKVAMRALQTGMKAQEMINQIRERVQKK